MNKVAVNLQRFREAAFAHDRENPTHSPAYGVCIAWHDLERLDFEDGEELWPGFRIFGDGGTSGNLRIICDRDELPALVREEKKDLVEA